MVSLKGSHYVPPAHEKIPYLIDEIFEMTLEIKKRAHVQIFDDLAFIKDRYPWITIPSQEKLNYFKAIEKSQLSDDISFFAEYIRSRCA
jgi:hypothetical protein